MQPIRSRSNPLVQRLRRLKQRAGAEDGLMLLEGPKLVLEALRSSVEIVEAAAAPRAHATATGREALETLSTAGHVPRLLDDALLSSLSEAETSQGLLALARRPVFEPDALFPARPALLLVLVGIQNPGNLGAVLRTAEAAGATGALLTSGCADPWGWKALRGSMGSAFRLPHLRGLGLDEAVALLRARSVRTLALRTGAATSYDAADLRSPCAVLVGNEGTGLPEQALAAADVDLSIPMAGAVESLNAGVAAALLLFEAARQRRIT
jgi:TrmH family RNA methyltransferase